MSTIFTKIINKEIPAFIVHETDNTLAFLDINPALDGHTLVIHKEPFATIFDMPVDKLQELMESVSFVSTMLKEKLEADGMNVYSNHGEAAGQVVPHLHFHLIPRYNDDEVDIGKGFDEKKEKNVTMTLEEVYDLLQSGKERN